MTPLLGMTLAELKSVAQAIGMPAFAGGQMAKWIYVNHVKDISEMTNKSRGDVAYTMIDVESVPTAEMIETLRKIDGVFTVRIVK